MSSMLRAAFAPKPEGSPQLTWREALAAWWLACRVPYLVTILVPVLLALAFALRTGIDINWIRMLLILLCCFLGLTLANYSNDLFDHIQGTDAGENIGGSRVLQAGLISPRAMSLAIVILVLLLCGIGALLVSMSHQYWLWIPGIFAILSAIFYVAPPIKYGYRGYGEIMVGLNMGFIMICASVTILAEKFIPASLALALPVALMVAAILYYQSLPEIETDPAAGKHTLASRLGKTRGIMLFRISWPIIWLLMINLWACGITDWPVFLGLLAFPLYYRADRLLHQTLAADTNWTELDQHGHLVRKLYLLNGLALILGVIWQPLFS